MNIKNYMIKEDVLKLKHNLINKIKDLRLELSIFTNVNIDGKDNLSFDIIAHYGYLKGSISTLEEILTQLEV